MHDQHVTHHASQRCCIARPTVSGSTETRPACSNPALHPKQLKHTMISLFGLWSKMLVVSTSSFLSSSWTQPFLSNSRKPSYPATSRKRFILTFSSLSQSSRLRTVSSNFLRSVVSAQNIKCPGLRSTMLDQAVVSDPN